MEKKSKNDDVHVMPNLPEDHPWAHKCLSNCWCEPEIIFTAPGGTKVWLHKEFQ